MYIWGTNVQKEAFFVVDFFNAPHLKKRNCLITKQCLYSEAFQHNNLCGKMKSTLSDLV